MNGKVFHGKTLEEAILKACDYFDVARSKLQIDILEDAKKGLFGIVDAHDATIRARLADTVSKMEEVDSVPNDVTSEETPLTLTPVESKEKPRKPRKQTRSLRNQKSSPIDGEPDEKTDQDLDVGVSGVSGLADDASQDIEPTDDSPRITFEDLDQEKLLDKVIEAANCIIGTIAPDAKITATINSGKVDLSVDCDEEYSPILIGRDGQTLLAVQYLIANVASSSFDAPVRIHVNVLDYRDKEDTKIKELANFLADRVRNTGLSCATKPMSSYNRRIIHLALENDPDVTTHSIGEGALKRVVVYKIKKEEIEVDPSLDDNIDS